MKNFIVFVLMFSGLFLGSTSCQNETNAIISPTRKGSARGATAFGEITLDEVTVTATRTDYSNLFETVYKLSIGHDYHVSSNPYTAFTEEYSGEDINEIPHIMDIVLTRLNMELRNHGISSFKDEEMAILRTLTIRQVFQIYTAIESANNLANVAMNQLHEPVDNGYSNAFRHFYLAFGVARAVGPDIAQQFMDAHEAGEAGLSTEMDTRNNDYAIYIYRNNLAGSNYVSYNFLMGLAYNGQLWTIQNGILGQFSLPKSGGPKGPQN